MDKGEEGCPGPTRVDCDKPKEKCVQIFTPYE